MTIATVVGDGVVAFLLVGAPGLATLAAVDDQNRALDAPKKLDRLRGIEWLRRGGAVQRIEFPNPFASVVLLHSGLRQV